MPAMKGAILPATRTAAVWQAESHHVGVGGVACDVRAEKDVCVYVICREAARVRSSACRGQRMQSRCSSGSSARARYEARNHDGQLVGLNGFRYVDLKPRQARQACVVKMDERGEGDGG